MFLTLPIREILHGGARARIVRLDLSGHAFPYLAGQAVMVASHGHKKRKAYSLATAPEEACRTGTLELLVGVNERGRAGTHLDLQVGTLVDVEGPHGQFVFRDDGGKRALVFIAGGTGIAPLRAMLRRALETPGRRIGVLYSARTPDDFAYESELRDLARQGAIDLNLTVTREHPGAGWTGARGRLSAHDLAPLIPDSRTRCFICGPPALVEEIPKLLAELGIPEDGIHFEEW